jgi:hypothetical protein
VVFDLWLHGKFQRDDGCVLPRRRDVNRQPAASSVFFVAGRFMTGTIFLGEDHDGVVETHGDDMGLGRRRTPQSAGVVGMLAVSTGS